jgi:hypothetical protein
MPRPAISTVKVKHHSQQVVGWPVIGAKKRNRLVVSYPYNARREGGGLPAGRSISLIASAVAQTISDSPS